MILSQNIYGYGSWVVIFIVLFDISKNDAVDIISKEEGHVCPTSPLTPSPPKKNKQQQANEKYTNIVQPCGTSNNTS
jgi:hypothetical protein